MKQIYQTVYKASYGTVTARFKEEMTLHEAVELGMDYCDTNGYKYISTELI